jgi:hypothetical protein
MLHGTLQAEFLRQNAHLPQSLLKMESAIQVRRRFHPSTKL